VAEALSKKRLKRLAAFCVSAAILYAIFARIDLGAFARHFAAMDWGWFGVAMLVFVPIFLLRAARFRYMMSGAFSHSDAVKMILASGALNMILPSKGGELAKGFFIRRHMETDLKTSFSAVIFERVLDVLALVVVMFAGLFLFSDDSALAAGAWTGGGAVLCGVAIYFYLNLAGPDVRGPLSWIRSIPKLGSVLNSSAVFVRDAFASGKISSLVIRSIALWLVHIFQFYCFFQALGYQGPPLSVLAYTPAAIFIGLLPVTVAGIGTRDLALIAFFAPLASAELAAGVAILSHLRYILPALVGIPFMRRYLKDS